MIERVKILSAAYYFTGDTVYAHKTSELLRVWFLNNDTYMNPNLQHSEVITGKITEPHLVSLLEAIFQWYWIQ
jgi:hypothetical protein